MKILSNEDIDKEEVMITKNGQKHCVVTLRRAGETLRDLEHCFPAEAWSIEKMEVKKDNVD